MGNISRRKLFGLGSAAMIAASIPASIAIAEKRKDVVEPILLERVCDNGESQLSREEREYFNKEYPNRYKGCGIRFQWYFASCCTCPNCGYIYLYNMEMHKSGKFLAR